MNSNHVKETLLNVKKDYEELLEFWQKEGSVSNAVEHAEIISALEDAINAVEKQGYADILSENTICGFCPRCNRLLEKSMVRPDPYYCPNCGQALRWGGSGIERLSGDFVRGYTKAIQSIIKIFEYVNDELTYRKKRMNYKLAMKLLKTILTERENIREERDGSIRWNIQKEDFEFYQRKDDDHE